MNKPLIGMKPKVGHHAMYSGGSLGPSVRFRITWWRRKYVARYGHDVFDVRGVETEPVDGCEPRRVQFEVRAD